MVGSNQYRPAHRANAAVRSPVVVVIGASLVVVLLGSLAVGYIRDVTGSGRCDTPATVEVAAAPVIAPVVRQAAADVPADTGGGCFEIAVKGVDSASMANQLAAPGPAGLPHAWLPESTWWLRQARVDDGAEAVPATGTPVARSPVVLAISAAVAEDLGAPRQPPSWQELLRPDRPSRVLGLPDPAGDPVGLSALLEIRRIADASGDPGPANAEILRRLSRNAAPAGRDLLPQTGGDRPGALEGVFASEQAVLAYNGRAGAAPLTAVYPDPATPALDFPFVVLPGVDEVRRQVAQRLLGATLDRGAAALAPLGLRSPAGAPVRDGTPPIRPDALPAPATVDRVLRVWAGVNLSARLLSVVDVSGSMATPAGGGQTRLGATVVAAGRLLGMLRDTTEVSLWRFAAELDGARDFREVLPLSPLYERRGDVFAALSGLQVVPARRTGLNDTTLAAYRQARGFWKPGRLNVVLIATDGRNNDRDGISRRELIDRLTGLRDPARPLPIIYFGLGPDVDAAALRAISGATGGRTFLSPDGSGVEELFFEALDFLARSAAPRVGAR
ncbi:VWA domain-containing protein [Actinomycetes bacterium KLBMP 9797]